MSSQSIKHPHGETLQAVRRLYAAMNRFDQQASSVIGVHPSDLRCINALERGGRSPSELATELGLTSGSMTALLDRLERAGFVLRERSKNDRRQYTIRLQPAFYARAEGVYAALGAAISRRLRRLGAEERMRLRDGLLLLAEAFDERR